MNATKFTNRTLIAAAAAAAVAMAGAACSGGSETSGETAQQTRAEPSRTVNGGTPATQRSAAELATAEFRVEGMTCGGCAIATEMVVKKLDGVESADAEYLGEGKSGRCTVTYDPSVVSTEQIAAAIEGAGYEPTLASTSSGA